MYERMMGLVFEVQEDLRFLSGYPGYISQQQYQNLLREISKLMELCKGLVPDSQNQDTQSL